MSNQTSTISTKRLRARLMVMAVAALAAIASLAVSAGTASAAATGADAVDVDHDGYYDTIVREAPWLPQYNVGALCTTPSYNTLKITIRPPKVWPISGSGLTAQTVYWQAVVTDRANNTLASGAWISGTAYRGEPTEFGASGDPNPPYIYASSYWDGSESFTRNISTGVPLVPWIHVAWLQRNGAFVYAWMRANWMAYNAMQSPEFGGDC
jgi:hypothetical protein